MNALAASAKYAPLARVQIASSATPGKSPDVYAGFALATLPADAKKTLSGSPAVQMLSYSVNGKEDDLLPRSLLTPPGTVQPFTLSYDGKEVVVELGAETKNFSLITSDPVVRLVCSTGEFLFTDVTITSSR
ncbi:hypothetical protein [Sphingomonas phyllosphaerae]|uniref:hypothetical protein n=1 Tax=Sphingomonas phyllosphaerae TaxID=257003 RepID=UPI002412ED2C|nr:hypothetical protein [Sphingomonas phyllosphaerae]